jgi:hypothetical protein
MTDPEIEEASKKWSNHFEAESFKSQREEILLALINTEKKMAMIEDKMNHMWDRQVAADALLFNQITNPFYVIGQWIRKIFTKQ